MVDGININSPRLSGNGETGKTVPVPAVASAGTQATQPPKAKTVQPAHEVQNNAASVIAKSTEKRLVALTAGNTLDFLKTAEKFIDASLPNKPPGTKLRIDLDKDSGRFVYQGVDVKTGEVVIQFPSEEILKLIAFNRERDGVEGIVVDEEA